MKIIFIVLLMSVISLHSQTYKIKNYVMGSSAATVSNDDFNFRNTLGQPAIGKIQNVDNIIGSGFWYTIGKTADGMHIIYLNLGWNLISTYVEPEIAALENIFSEIEGSTVIVKNNSGQIYYPEFDINDIGNWDVKQAYQVYMSKAEMLTIPGEKVVPETTEITLSTGWNMLAYLRDNALDIEIALASLVADDKLVIAKDNMGNVFYPAFDINMIGNMLPGQGYQIYLISGATLTYPEN
ncbi:MAG: hypothetical protein CVV22_06910 [Ignavibacteriae bacterium HGW-Ignavibacteriae-1]|jgi:hypothetical protein|nr:MAG: hypothetical protein CVV22_06910 [Ignavibacteriae bacterium HGW-Ignavibacteriae-1]